MITVQQLMAALAIPLERATAWVDPINAVLKEFGIDTPLRQAAFIAQIGVESGGLSALVESFNYSVDGLTATFGKRIAANAAILGRRPDETTVPLERQIRIASIVYAGRYGNGDAGSGDGWKYRGRGLKQLTFADNYAQCASALGINLILQPDLLGTDKALAARSGGWFWHTIGGNGYADSNDFDGLSTRINGAGITPGSLAARRLRFATCKRALGVA